MRSKNPWRISINSRPRLSTAVRLLLWKGMGSTSCINSPTTSRAMVRSLREREKQLLTSQANTARSNQDLLLLTEFARYLQQVRSEDEIGAAAIKQIRRITNAGQIGLYLRYIACTLRLSSSPLILPLVATN